MTLPFLNDVANDAGLIQIRVISLKSEKMGNLINRIPGLRLLI